MSVDDESVCELTERVFGTTLGWDLQRGAAERARLANERSVTGCVHVSGGWNGAMTVSCGTELARRIASAMFEVPAEDTSLDEVRDAVGELANMIGGGFKALMPGPSTLSMPTVAEGRDYSLHMPGSAVGAELWFLREGEPIVVRVHERAA